MAFPLQCGRPSGFCAEKRCEKAKALEEKRPKEQRGRGRGGAAAAPAGRKSFSAGMGRIGQVQVHGGGVRLRGAAASEPLLALDKTGAAFYNKENTKNFEKG